MEKISGLGFNVLIGVANMFCEIVVKLTIIEAAEKQREVALMKVKSWP